MAECDVAENRRKPISNDFPLLKMTKLCSLTPVFHYAVSGCEGYLFITKPHTFRNYDSGLKRNTLSCFIIEFYQVDLKCDITSTSSLQRSFPKPANICNDFVAVGQVLSSWEDRVRFSKFISSYFSHSVSGISLFIRLIILEPHWHPIIPFYIIDYV